MQPRTFHYEEADGVAVVRLERPERLNALTFESYAELRDTFRALGDRESVRSVVLTGTGRAFCSGLDVKGMFGSPLSAKAKMEELLHRPEGELSNLAQDVGFLWRRVPAPVIAVTHGVCFGGGFQIAWGADMRISHPKCRFSVMEAKWGLVPDMSATVTLRERVPKDVAMELTMTGRIFPADEALSLGLLTRLHDEPLAEAERLAREIASRSPDATAAAKRMLHATFTDGCTEERALHLETELQRQLIGERPVRADSIIQRASARLDTPQQRSLNLTATQEQAIVRS